MPRDDELFDWEEFTETSGVLPNRHIPDTGYRGFEENYDYLAEKHGLDRRPIGPQTGPAAVLAEEGEEVLDWSDAWSGGLGDVITDFIPIWSGVKELGESKDLWDAAKRIELETATEADFSMVKRFMDEAAADKTIGYHINNILRQLPAFALEIFVGLGVAKKAASSIGL